VFREDDLNLDDRSQNDDVLGSTNDKSGHAATPTRASEIAQEIIALAIVGSMAGGFVFVPVRAC
jgi:hypothetical protein